MRPPSLPTRACARIVRHARSWFVVVAASAAALAPPAALGAQGSVGTQGFGYPTGQLSTRARSAGGAVAPFDAQSPLNPAALTSAGEATVYAQFEPEFRTVRVSGAQERSTLSRFPLVFAAIPVGSRTVIGIAASTLLDRTFETNTSVPQTIADTTFGSRQSRRSVGGVTDVRAAAARALSRSLSVGLGVHGYTGENRVSVSFADDSARFISFTDSARLNYSGLAASAGVTWRASPHLIVGGSYKLGGALALRDEISDRKLGSGDVPDAVTGGVLYDGITGTTLAASVAWQGWSSMNGLGIASFNARDTRAVALGADAAGPRLGRTAIVLRAGASWRELPFPVPGRGAADELSFAVGAGIPLASNRAALDLGAQRAQRDAGDARETSWLFSLGLLVRP